MFKNYLYLLRCDAELNFLLNDAIIHDIYSQDKNKLYIHIPVVEEPDRHLILNTDSLFNFPLLKKEHKKAKKNVINLWSSFLPAKIKSIEIADSDRVIKFSTDKFNLYFALWGGISNVVLQSDKNFFYFKKTKNDNFYSQIINLNFISPLSPVSIEYDEYTPENVKGKLFFFRKDYIGEFELRLASSNLSSFDIITEIIAEVLSERIAVSELEAGKLKIHPTSFYLFKNAKLLKEFDSINNAVHYYITEYYKRNNILIQREALEKYLHKELSKTANRLNDLKARIDRGSIAEEYKKYADLLLANRHKINKGDKDITVEDFDSGKLLKIKLDPKLSVQSNIDKYYEKSRDEKISYRKSCELYDLNLDKYQTLKGIEQSLQDSNQNDLNELYSKYIAGIKKMEKRKEIKYKHYIAEGKYHIYVGKDNKNNDELTFKFAKQNDFWLHVRGYPGSHVILKTENAKEGVPKNIIKVAASLAAYHSKAKTAGLVPVIYTFRKYVRKGKGMAPGQVAVQREKSVIVPPEIPKNCEFVED